MPTAHRTHLPALTGLRGLAALWVLAFHMRVALELVVPGAAAARFFTEAGYLGVDLFFALSGFVIAHACGRELARDGSASARWQFMLRRFARIYPVHLFVIVVLVAGIALSRAIGRDLAAGGDYSVANLVRHLTLSHVWLPGGAASWNEPAWSIHAEWFAYAAFPFFAAALLRATNPRRLLLGCVACYAALIAIVELALAGNYDRTYDYGVLRVVAGFTAGALLWQAWRLGALDGPRLARLAGVWPLVALACLAVDRGHALALPAVAMCVPASVIGRGWFTRLLSTRPLQYLGKISYPLYMIHAVLLIQLEARLPLAQIDGAAARALVLACYVAAILGGAHVVHRWVEEPARRLLLRRELRAAPVRT